MHLNIVYKFVASPTFLKNPCIDKSIGLIVPWAKKNKSDLLFTCSGIVEVGCTAGILKIWRMSLNYAVSLKDRLPVKFYFIPFLYLKLRAESL